MHRRTINKILRQYPSCKNLDKSISLWMKDDDLIKSFFNKDAVPIMACCSLNSIYCMMEDNFPYFYDHGACHAVLNKVSFFFNIYKSEHLLLCDPYNSIEEIKKVFSKFIKHETYLNILNDMLINLNFQQSAYFSYRFDIETEVNLIEYLIGSGSYSFCIKLRFTDQSVIVDFITTVDGCHAEANFFGNFDSFSAVCDRGFRLSGLDFMTFENLCDINTDFVSMAKIQKIYNY